METKKIKFDKKHYHELKHIIDGFAELEFDWNGNEAEPFELQVINNSRDFLELVKDYAEIISVFPTAIKAIQFEYEYEGLYCEIEIYKDKFSRYAIKNKVSSEKEFNGLTNIIEAANDFLSFLRN